jgi:hypothetical protein
MPIFYLPVACCVAVAQHLLQGVPYAKKYHEPGTALYDSPIFLDCCGLVRQVLRDMAQDLGFSVGPWNQAYQLDTLPLRLPSIDMLKPGDLVFYLGNYTNPSTRPQKHNCVHVEVYIGGQRTLGARWGKGVVQEHDSYTFTAKSWSLTEYVFCSIDTWLQGVCKSHCCEHDWKRACEWQPAGVLLRHFNSTTCFHANAQRTPSSPAAPMRTPATKRPRMTLSSAAEETLVRRLQLPQRESFMCPKATTGLPHLRCSCDDHFSLFTFHFSLFTFHFSLFTFHFSLFTPEAAT